MPLVVIITYSDYPNGSAGAIRYATFAQAYADMGYDVVVLSKSNSSDDDRIKTISLACTNRYNQFILFSYRAIQVLSRLRMTNSIEGVILGSDVVAVHASIIQNWCRWHNIKCILDATEWYSKQQFTNWFTSFYYWEKEYLNRFVIDRKSRVIAISSYLYDYFKRKGCKVVQIPIIINNNNALLHNSVLRNDNKINIIYAGSHLLMDNIPLIIKSISLLSAKDRKKINFFLYGLSEKQIEGYIPRSVLNNLEGVLHIMGRRPNSEVMTAYSQSDFSIVLRDPSLRVNKAGFPSKVVESMRLGIPVISNYSSDLKTYLVHNVNSIIVNELNEMAICTQLQSLIQMSRDDISIIGKNAQQTVERELCSTLFEQHLKNIIS